VTARHIEQFLGHRLDEGSAPKTAIVDIKTLGSALRRAENFGYIDKNPVLAVKLPKAVSSERAVFVPDEISRLIQATPNEDWQTLIMLATYTGARMSDCLAMTWDNVDSDRRVLVYSQKKTGKTVATPIHVDLLIHLGRLSQKSTVGHLCRSLSSHKQAGKRGLSEGFKRIVVRAGLDLMTVKGKGTRNFARRTFHSLRHSFSSMLANAGVSEETRMRLTGHASRDIHQKYTHIDVEPLQRAIESIPMGSRAETSKAAFKT
jgi:integrase